MAEVDAMKWAQLTRPFEAGQINKIPRGPVTVDYIGHAYITERLNEVDPSWALTPGEIVSDGDLVYMRVTLTVLGVTRHEVGCADRGKDEWPKLLYSDAITRAAMRFGVGLDLWKKIGGGAGEYDQRRSQPRQASPASSPVQQRDPTLAAILDVLKVDVEHLDMTGMAAWTTWKEEHPKWWADLDTLVAARDLVMGLLVSASSEEPF